MPTISPRQPDLLRIGFVPLVDCAPLVIAEEFGFFEKRGLQVELLREPGWATIREKIVYRELEAAHALAGLCFAINWGLGVLKSPCLTGFLFNSHGDAITLSTELIKRGASSPEGLKKVIAEWKTERPPTFAVPHRYSSHLFLLRQWLRPAGLIPAKDFEVVVMPPSLMPGAMRSGYLDGYCVGEPFNSEASISGCGEIVAESAELAHLHPEKALLVHREFSETRESEHLALIAALTEAAALCDTEAGREEAATILARPEYLDQDREQVRRSLLPATREANCDIHCEDFHIFSRSGVNRPSDEKANWIIAQLRQAGELNNVTKAQLGAVDRIFRADLFDRAVASEHPSTDATPTIRHTRGKTRS